MKYIKCPMCDVKYVSKDALYGHIEKEHSDELEDKSPAQLYFNLTRNKTQGLCVICRSPVKFNEVTEKYNRFCENPECKKNYIKEFRNRMMKVYNKEHLLNDPEKQKEMLANRKISGEYLHSDGIKIQYTGSYEKGFLVFLDTILEYPASDVVSPAPFTIAYEDPDTGAQRMYIPDFFFPSLNLIVEIKYTDCDNNSPYRNREIEMRINKKFAAIREGFYFIEMNKNYNAFVEKIHDITNKK